jgi:hypothetical protein
VPRQENLKKIDKFATKKKVKKFKRTKLKTILENQNIKPTQITKNKIIILNFKHP